MTDLLKLERISPEEFKKGLKLGYSLKKTALGEILVASTDKGLCFLGFGNEKFMMDDLKKRFPTSTLTESENRFNEIALSVFASNGKLSSPLPLLVYGTDFQVNVWNALIKIPFGKLTSYGQIAAEIGNPKASRAVGSAVGDNPISFFIPCHRVVRSTGEIGQYFWGTEIKKAIIAWEKSIVNY